MLRRLLLVATAAIALAALGSPVAEGAPRQADLAVTTVRTTPASVTAGEPLSVRVKLRNKGARPAARSSMALLLSRDARRSRGDIRLARRTAKAIKRGKTAALQAQVVVPRGTAVGAWRVLACADDARRIRERSERNNCKAGAAVQVRPALGPPATLPPLPPSAGPGDPPPPASESTPAPTTTPSAGPFPRPADPLTVEPTADTARAVAKHLGPAGGSLTATSADGDTFELTIPAGALMSVQQIRMTPLTAVGGLPLSGGLAAAVRLEPEGIALQHPATLRITPDVSPSADAATPFLFHQGGEDLHRFPEDPADGEFVLALEHFSSAGIGSGTAADRGTMDAHPPSRAQAQLEADTAAIWDERRRNPDADIAGRLAAAYVSAYDGWIDPLANQALTNDRLAAQAIAALNGWSRAVELVGVAGMEGVAERHARRAGRVQAILRNAAEKAAERCAGHEVREIGRLIALARVAAIHGYDLGDPFQDALDCARWELDVTGHVVTQRSSGSITTEYTTDWKNEKLLITPAADLSGIRGEQPITYTEWSIVNDPDDCFPKQPVSTRVVSPAIGQIGFDLDFKELPAEEGQPPQLDISPLEVVIGYFTGVHYERLDASNTCGGTDDPPETDSGFLFLAWGNLHFDEAAGPLGMAIRDWTAGPGGVWTKTYDRTLTSDAYTWTEKTDLTLRHVPQID